MKRVVFSADARRDVAQAWEYIAADNVTPANGFLARIEYALDLLAGMPTMGHTRDARYRFWTVKPCLIAYRFNSRTVTVVRLIHGARDLRRIFR